VVPFGEDDLALAPALVGSTPGVGAFPVSRAVMKAAD
jgi:hypothetical protein